MNRLSTVNRLFTLTTVACALFFGSSFCCSTVFAQGGDGGGFDGGGLDGGAADGGGQDFTNQTPVTQDTGATQTPTTNDGGTQTPEAFDLPDFEFTEIMTSENIRRRGFVGANTENLIEGSEGLGFVGPDTTLTENGTFGGQSDFAGGGAGGGGATANAQTFFTVERAGIRARVRPVFRGNRPPTMIMSSNFQNRLNRIPATAGIGQGIRVDIQNETAIINGFVPTEADAEMIHRQLQLEPGVYHIENRTQFGR